MLQGSIKKYRIAGSLLSRILPKASEEKYLPVHLIVLIIFPSTSLPLALVMAHKSHPCLMLSSTVGTDRPLYSSLAGRGKGPKSVLLCREQE